MRQDSDPAGEHGLGERRRITQSIIALHKEFFGRGPVAGKTYLSDDVVLVLLNDGHTRAEETLGHSDGGEEVARQRVRTTAAIEGELAAVVEQETSRKVASFLSSSKQDPSLISYVFVLEPNEVLSLVPDEASPTPTD